MRTAILFLAVVIFFSTQAQFRNVKIAEATEGVFPHPAIAVSQKDPANIIVGMAPDQVIYTTDEGMTWNNVQLTSTFGVQGRPALISDSKGHLYYFHQARANEQGFTDKLVLQKTTDKGKSWSEMGLIAVNPAKDLRRQSLTLHPKRQSFYATWTQFDKYESPDTSFHSTVFFAKSGGGEKWNTLVPVSNRPGNSRDNDKAATGSSAVVDMDGRVFISWANQEKIYMDRSYDGGEVWLKNDIVLVKQHGGSFMEIPGLGETSGLPSMVMDNSASPYRGSIYVVWADQSKGTDDTDIWMIHSNNRGDNWTTPLRINSDEPGTHQFMPSITVDQTTGYVYIIYYDRRHHDDLRPDTDVYLAYSMDGGNHFKDVKISETPFSSSEVKSFSDGTSISAHKNCIAPVWVRVDEGRYSVWTTVIQEKDLVKGK